MPICSEAHLKTQFEINENVQRLGGEDVCPIILPRAPSNFYIFFDKVDNIV
jgi:hypothetical protein